MSLEQKVHAIARILEHVPVPYLEQAAQAVDDVLTIAEQEHAAGQLNREDWRSALVAAREPWEQIRRRAQPASAADLGISTGSIGD